MILVPEEGIQDHVSSQLLSFIASMASGCTEQYHETNLDIPKRKASYLPQENRMVLRHHPVLHQPDVKPCAKLTRDSVPADLPAFDGKPLAGAQLVMSPRPSAFCIR